MWDLSGGWGLALLGGAVVALGLIQRRHTARVRSDRARLFEGCSDVLDMPVVVNRGLNFPVLQGRWCGHDVRVEPVADTLSMRTLPVLWLVVTMRGHHDRAGSLSVLARVCGNEFYARHRESGRPVPVGPEWPAELSVTSTGLDGTAEWAGMLERIRAVMSDRAVKQVVVGSTGIRLVLRCTTADAATYRVTRRADLTGARVDTRDLQAALDAMLGLLRHSEPCRDSVALPVVAPERAAP